MAAPEQNIEDPNWHRSISLHQECEWKQGESAVARNGYGRKITACGSKEANLHSPFPFPQGKAGAGGWPAVEK
jgi:hypothetical protein